MGSDSINTHNSFCATRFMSGSHVNGIRNSKNARKNNNRRILATLHSSDIRNLGCYSGSGFDGRVHIECVLLVQKAREKIIQN